MSIYSNAATYGGGSSHRPHSHSHSQSQSYRPQGQVPVQGSGQIYGASNVGGVGRPGGGVPGGGGYSGYQPGPPAGLPAGADPQLWQWFQAVDADRSGQISVNELQAALVNGECGQWLLLSKRLT